MAKTSIFDDLSGIAQRSKDIARDEGRGCQCCGTLVGVERRPQKTMYPYPEEKWGDENDPNWVTLCPDCHLENDAYWNERWEEYYGGLL